MNNLLTIIKTTFLLSLLSVEINAQTKYDELVCIKKVIKSFHNGYTSAFRQIEKEFDTQGWQERPIFFKKYMAVVDVSKLTQAQVFLYKYFATVLGEKPITTKNNLLVISSSDRRADTVQLIDKLNNKYLNSFKYKTYLLVNKLNNKFISYPLVNKTIYDKIKEDVLAKTNVKLLIIDKSQSEGLKNKKIEEEIYGKYRE
ncbi:hypothetical protein MNB_ARC-1_1129 [hydrothermal vent metagenome]|uniref:Uncharacterized protein n=1 Tax=hydrothermal vent metagenome TaxID=652676 RepID=A0A3B1E5S8_9ZZZZ